MLQQWQCELLLPQYVVLALQHSLGRAGCVEMLLSCVPAGPPASFMWLLLLLTSAACLCHCCGLLPRRALFCCGSVLSSQRHGSAAWDPAAWPCICLVSSYDTSNACFVYKHHEGLPSDVLICVCGACLSQQKNSSSTQAAVLQYTMF